MNTNPIKSINLKAIKLQWGVGSGWFRIFGYGIGYKDLRKHNLLFSERNGITKILRLGNYSFKLLKP